LYFFKSRRIWDNWSKASTPDFQDLLLFLKPGEHTSVPFTSRLLNASQKPDSHMLNRNTVLIERKSGRITGALMLSPEGIVCPVLSNESSLEPLHRMVNSSSYYKKKYLTLMGAVDDISEFEKLFTNKKRLSVDYKLLCSRSDSLSDRINSYLNLKEASRMDITIHRALNSDLEKLMPLRKAYEIEEVILNPNNFNEGSCRRRFALTIDEQAVFYAENRGIPIATSCINACGIDWFQIGGVYTLPEYRGRGISAMLMARLAEHAVSTQKDLTLFVKKDNPAAIKLYSNCGFKKMDGYRISYLESR